VQNGSVSPEPIWWPRALTLGWSSILDRWSDVVLQALQGGTLARSVIRNSPLASEIVCPRATPKRMHP
jgi:hypothetical protein